MKRRKVFRVVAAYGGVAFVVLEVASIVFPAIPLPAWTLSLVVWLTILGLPIAAVLAWAFEMTPEGVRRTEDAAPEDIDSIMSAPARTRWPPGLLALGGIVLLGIGFYGGRRSSIESLRDARLPPSEPAAEPGLASPVVVEDRRPAIAVLPFADMSPEQDQGYFSDGISEEILQVLSKVRDLRVAARSSAFSYKGQDTDPRQIGEKLGVPYLLDGSVRKDGDQIRISVELVNASDGFRLWSETYDRRLQNVFEIQREIAEAIAGELRVPLGLTREALVTPTPNMDAYDLYLAGRAAMRRRGPGVGEAIGLFESVIALDSMWAPAWAALAESHAMHPLYTGLGGESTDSTVWAQSLSAAEAAAGRALALDPRNASARVALGGVHRDRREWEEGERELLRALEIDPDNHEARTQYAELLWGMGRLDESLREAGRALALDRAPVRLDIEGFTLYMNGRWEEAEAVLDEGIAMDQAGDVHFLRTVLGNLFLFDGRYREALDRFSFYLPDTAGFRMQGEALEAHDPSLLPADEGQVFPQVWMLLGEPERALDALEDMVFAMPFRVQYHIWDPLLAPIWDTPRFQDVILPRMRLEGAQARFSGTVAAHPGEEGR
jgi:TolB-like protein